MCESKQGRKQGKKKVMHDMWKRKFNFTGLTHNKTSRCPKKCFLSLRLTALLSAEGKKLKYFLTFILWKN
jgi:hypothetical protein